MSAAAACALALVLALDASTSIAAPDWKLQVEATGAALASEQAVRAIEASGGVAVAAIGFTEDPGVMVPWTVLRDGRDARDFAARLAEAGRPPGSYTDIAGAIDAALLAMEVAPCEAERRVIDLSSDGKASAWLGDTAQARDRAQEAGVTINAIGVGDEAPGWLRENAVTAGGFAVESADWAGYASALKRKITQELAAR